MGFMKKGVDKIMRLRWHYAQQIRDAKDVIRHAEERMSILDEADSLSRRLENSHGSKRKKGSLTTKKT